MAVDSLRSVDGDAVVVESKTPVQFIGITVVAISVGSSKVTIA